MAERRLDLVVGTSYNGGGLKSATADLQKLRQQMALPVMGPLGRDDQAVENMVVARVRAMERAADKARVTSRVDEILHGTAPRAAASRLLPRFTADEQAIRDRQATLVRSWREQGREARINEEAQRRLLGDTSGADKQAAALKKMADEAKKSRGAMADLIEIVRKFGTSSGTDTMFEKLTKLMPVVGMALAGVKGLAIVGNTIGAVSDTARHNRQMNLDRQLADEQRWNEVASTMSLGFGPAMAKSNFLGFGYANAGAQYALSRTPLIEKFFGGPRPFRLMKDDQEAIEQLEDETKRQDRHTDVLARRAAVEKELIANAKVFIDQYRVTSERAGRSAEYGRYLDAAEENRLLQKRVADRAKGAEVAPEVREELALRSVAALRALRDSYAADLGRIKGMGSSFADAGRQFLAENRDRLFARRDTDSRIGELRLRDSGRGYEADVKRIRDDANAALAEEGDPVKRAKIAEEARAKEESRTKQYHRELLDSRAEFTLKMEDVDRSHAERRLRLMGKSLDADKLQLVNALEAQTAEIRARYEKQIRENPAEAATLRGRAARELGAAGADFALSRAEMLRERAMRFLPGEMAAGITGDSKLATGAVGRGELEAARARDLMLRQLKAQEDVAAAMKELPAKVAEAFKGAMEAMGFGPSDPSEYPWGR